MAAFLLNERNERMFVFRPASGQMEATWTTVALDSTATVPKLTIDPYNACDRLVNILGKQCPDVSMVMLSDQYGNVITLEQVRAIPFIPLPGGLPGVTEMTAPVLTHTAAGGGGSDMRPPSSPAATMALQPPAGVSSAYVAPASVDPTTPTAAISTLVPTPLEQTKIAMEEQMDEKIASAANAKHFVVALQFICTTHSTSTLMPAQPEQLCPHMSTTCQE